MRSVNSMLAIHADAATDATPLVSVTNIRKTYFTRQAPVQAVASASLDVARGEFVSLLGPSGCGKSTLLMMIAGLERPTGGSILLGGIEVKQPRREIGVIFQDATLLPWKSALDNYWPWSVCPISRTRSRRIYRGECGSAWQSAVP